MNDKLGFVNESRVIVEVYGRQLLRVIILAVVGLAVILWAYWINCTPGNASKTSSQPHKPSMLLLWYLLLFFTVLHTTNYVISHKVSDYG